MRRSLACFCSVLALGISLAASASNPPQNVAPNRITQTVDDAVRIKLKGNVHPLATAANDRGPAEASMPALRLTLLLKHSPTQAQAVREYIDKLQDKNSPSYHKWLTPEEFGAKFGPSDQDIETVTAWMRSQGFTINRVAKARNLMEFSGTVGQVQSAFHTSIHSYVVNGEKHFANSTDPEIPAALAPIVAGITQLHDFNPKSHRITAPQAHLSANGTHGKQITWVDPYGYNALYFTPADAAILYNTPNSALNPSYKGTTYDGTGVTVGIVGDSNFTMQDVSNYRAFFLNDATSNNLPNVIVDGNDPGVNGDAGEALLDNEIVTGLAHGAKINFYTAQDTDLQSGLFLAIYRALDDNTVDILNVSFGGCEMNQGQSGNEQIYYLWEQAAAQGISVTVSTGDSGSAGCDDDNTEATAQYGLAVNGLASTPFNVGVGGTDFSALTANYPSSFSQYMNPAGSVAPYYSSVAGYIPESIWNDSTYPNTTLDQNVSSSSANIIGGGGGASNCSSETSNYQCISGYLKPAFQGNLTPTDGVRDLPDVSLFASNGFNLASWAVCADSVALGSSTPGTDCQLSNGVPTASTTLSGFGGTSASAPAFAGMLALVSQSIGGRLGNPNPVLYQLAEKQPTAFNDVTIGNNSVDCYSGTPDCGSNGFLTGFNSGVGYDQASGLGSVNASNLVTTWPSVKFTPSTTQLELGDGGALGTSPIVVTHGTTISFSAAVDPGASVTGTVNLVTDSDVSAMPGAGSPGGFYPVNANSADNGIVTGSTNSLPGGSYNLYAYYGGDTNYAASKSNPVPVTISAEDSTTALTLSIYDATTAYAVPTSNAPYGSYFFATATPQGSNGADGLATGSVTFLNGSTAVGPAVNISSAGTASYNSLSQNALPVGSYQLSASYSGDASFHASTSTPAAFTVTKGQISTDLSTSASAVNYGGSVTLTALMTTDSIGSYPTGTITFMSGTTVLGTGTMAYGYDSSTGIDLVEGVATVSGTKFTKNGKNSITAVYAGDSNYLGSTSNSAAVTVSGVPTPKVGLTGPATLTIPGPGASADATMTVTPFGGFTGTVNLTCSFTGSNPSDSAPTCDAASASISGTASATTTLTFNSTSSTTPDTYAVIVTAADAAKTVSTTANISLTVTPAATPAFTLAATPVTVIQPATSGNSTVTVTPTGGFSGAVALTCSGVTGITCAASSATVTSGVATAPLSLQIASSVLPGSYSVAIAGTDSTGKITASTTASVTVQAAAVAPSLTISGTAVTIASPGAAATSTLTLTPLGGFTGAVAFSCTVASGPTGAVSSPTCQTLSATVSGTSPSTSTLNLETTSTTTPGAYQITVNATQSGAVVATTTIATTVNPPAVAAGFTLSSTAVSISGVGATGSSTITVTPAGGFTGQVNLSCALTSSPSGVNDIPTCSFAAGNSVLISTSAPATATVTITSSATATSMLVRSGAAVFAGLLLFWVPAKRRKRLTMLALLLFVGSFAVGCGGSSSKTAVVGTGAFTYTVTGTDAASGALVSKTIVTVNVQ
jgi:hypothetical protein